MLWEEFYSDGTKILRDHNITANDQGQFPLEIPLSNLDEESFSVFIGSQRFVEMPISPIRGS